MYRVRKAASLAFRAARVRRRRCGRVSTIEVFFIVAFLLSPALTGWERHFYIMAQAGARLFSSLTEPLEPFFRGFDLGIFILLAHADLALWTCP
jgi:hypothetical protein